MMSELAVIGNLVPFSVDYRNSKIPFTQYPFFNSFPHGSNISNTLLLGVAPHSSLSPSSLMAYAYSRATATINRIRNIPQTKSLLQTGYVPIRGLATYRSKDESLAPTLVYRRIRRGHSLMMSGLAGAQASFWAYTAYLTSQAPEPLLSPAWTVGGLGLSVAFAAMVNAYLTRSVAEISIIHGANEQIRVITSAIGGRLSDPVLIDPSKITGGPHKDSAKERYWTFAIKPEGKHSKFHFIVDTSRGVQDKVALAALARGGEHFLALSHKRRAAEMKERWSTWQRAKQNSDKSTP